MKKLLLFSDLHLKVIDPLGTPTDDGLNTRVKKKLELLSQVVGLAREHRVDYIVDLGDTFDRINPPDRLRSAYIEIVADAIRYGIDWIRVLGNHESDGIHKVGLDVAMLSHPHYRVVDGIEDLIVEGIHFISEIPTERLVSWLTARWNGETIIGHFGVEGVKSSSDLVLDGVSQALFTKCAGRVYLGHIHKRQSLLGGRIKYIGCIARDDFGDKDVPTGVHIIEVGVGYGDDQVIEVEDSPMVELEVSDENEFHNLKAVDGTIVKVVFVGSKTWFHNVDAAQAKRDLFDHGAVRVLTSFRSTDETSASIPTFVGTDVEKLVRDRAMTDKRNPDLGLGYLRAAMEEEEK